MDPKKNKDLEKTVENLQRDVKEMKKQMEKLDAIEKQFSRLDLSAVEWFRQNTSASNAPEVLNQSLGFHVLKGSIYEWYLDMMNTADDEHLRDVMGIGEKYFDLLLKARQEHGPKPFKNLDDLESTLEVTNKQMRILIMKELKRRLCTLE